MLSPYFHFATIGEKFCYMRHSGVATRDDGDDNVLLHLRRAFLLRLTLCFATSMNGASRCCRHGSSFFVNEPWFYFASIHFFCWNHSKILLLMSLIFATTPSDFLLEPSISLLEPITVFVATVESSWVVVIVFAGRGSTIRFQPASRIAGISIYRS